MLRCPHPLGGESLGGPGNQTLATDHLPVDLRGDSARSRHRFAGEPHPVHPVPPARPAEGRHDARVEVDVMLGIQVGRLDAGVADSPDLEIKLRLDLLGVHPSLHQASPRFRPAEELALAIGESPGMGKDGGAFGEVQMDPDAEPGRLADKAGDGLELKAVGQNRGAGDDPPAVGLQDSTASRLVDAQLVRVDDDSSDHRLPNFRLRRDGRPSRGRDYTCWPPRRLPGRLGILTRRLLTAPLPDPAMHRWPGSSPGPATQPSPRSRHGPSGNRASVPSPCIAVAASRPASLLVAYIRCALAPRGPALRRSRC